MRCIEDADVARTEAVARNIRFPESYTDLCVNENPDEALMATGIDPKTNKKHYRYASWHHIQKRYEKFRRMYHMLKDLPRIRMKIRELLASSDETDRVHGMVLRLLDRCGLRPGNKDKYASDGLSTLRPEHINISDSGIVTIKFMGKGNQLNTCRIVNDPTLVRTIYDLDTLSFKGVPVSFRKHIWPYQLKDFRTLGACRFFLNACLHSKHKFRKTAVQKAFGRTAKAFLNNTYKVARLNYIDRRLELGFVRGDFKMLKRRLKYLPRIPDMDRTEQLLLLFYETYGGENLAGWKESIRTREKQLHRRFNLERRRFNHTLGRKINHQHKGPHFESKTKRVKL